MRKIIKKLGSQQGITILLSLFLFLICTVAGSVLITAGTAASGTISERAELDQRYFSVMSAAELLRDKFDGKSVRVTVNSADVEISRIVNDKLEYVPLQHNVETDKWVEFEQPDKQVKPEEEWVILRSLYLLTSPNPAPPTIDDEYTLTVNTGNTWDAKLTTDIKIEASTAKRFIFTVKNNTVENNNDDDKKKPTFRVKMEYSVTVLQDGVDADNTNTYTFNWEMGKISVVTD